MEDYIMESKFRTSLKQFMHELGVKEVYLPDEPDKLFLYHPEVNRPGLALAGFKDFFDNTRIQIFGRSEIRYIECLDEQTADERVEFICQNKPPLLVVTRNLPIPPVLLEKAKKFMIPLCTTDESSCAFLASAISVLSVTLAPRITRHGVFMEILGVKVPTVTIPVKPGRNLAVIIEAATRNLRLKKLGYNAARDLMVSLGMPEEELPPQEKIINNVF